MGRLLTPADLCYTQPSADVAQLVEQRYCKPLVAGSIPVISSRRWRQRLIVVVESESGSYQRAVFVHELDEHSAIVEDDSGYYCLMPADEHGGEGQWCCAWGTGERLTSLSLHLLRNLQQMLPVRCV